jgi:hypothetical protein
VNPVQSHSGRGRFEQAAGGGKMPIKKNAVCIFINKKEKYVNISFRLSGSAGS